MRTLKFLLQKEFLQIFRNRALLRSMLLAPLIQLLILPQAANFEIKHILLTVVDHDHSSYSQKMVSKILSSGYFELAGYKTSYKEASVLVEHDQTDIILEIPTNFEKNLVRENSEKIFLAFIVTSLIYVGSLAQMN